MPTNGAALKAFYYYVERIWLRTLRRRSQKDRFSWQTYAEKVPFWIHKFYDSLREYVTSQRHSGWIGLPEMYDDGGL